MSEEKHNDSPDGNGQVAKSSYEFGVDRFKSLNIPFNTQVYCSVTHTPLPVGDRTSAVGFCNVLWYDAGFYVTIDEKTAIEQMQSTAIWQMGFMVSKTLQDEYDHVGIKKQFYVKNPDGSVFLYWRNFPIKDYDLSHATFGYLHKDEIDLILQIEQGDKQSEEKISEELNNSFVSETPTIVHHSVTNNVKCQFVTDVTAAAIQSHKQWQITDTNCKFSLAMVTVQQAPLLSELLAGRNHIPHPTDRSWQNWTFEKFYDKILSCFAESNENNVLTKLKTCIANDVEKYSLDVLSGGDTSITSYIAFSKKLENLLDSNGVLSPDKAINPAILTPNDNKDLANYLFRLIRLDDNTTSNKSTPRLHFKQRLLSLLKEQHNVDDFESIEQFKICLLRTYNARLEIACNAGGFGFPLMPSAFPPAVSAAFMLDEANYMQVHAGVSGASPSKSTKGSYKGQTPRNQHLNNMVQTGKASTPCKGCGWSDICQSHTQCHYKAHPGYNSENISWASSANGRAYKTADIRNKGTDKRGKDKLCFTFHPDGTKLSEDEITRLVDGGMKSPYPKTDAGSKRPHNKNGEKINYEPIQILASYTTTKDDSYLRPFSILTSTQEVGVGKERRDANSKKELKALIDTGAVHSSYVNFETATKLQKLGLLHIPSNKRVCTGLNNASCTNVSKAYDIELSFLNELTNKDELLIIRAQVIDSRYDLIIGYPDIFNFELTSKFPSLFSKSWVEKNKRKDLRKQVDNIPIMQASNGSCRADCSCSLQETNPIPHEPLVEKYIVNRDALLDRITPDCDEIDDSVDPWGEIRPNETSESTDRIPDANLHGSAEFKTRIRKITDAYEEVFRSTLTPEPAKVQTFELKVDVEQWLKSAAGKAPRQMSREKMQEVERQIGSMLSLNLIRESTAPAVSHVMLAPKPNGKWRFCVDYRTLNVLSESLSWPIPNIKMMLDRIGSHRAKYYGVLDLSQGFYQIPLDEKSKALTAFITWCGTFEWNRLPMGIKGAPPFFQMIMATIVLVGLIYKICELYIDDILVHAENEDEFCDNLTQVLERCRKYNIKLNPLKCQLGLEEVEYVGHTINSNGIHFTRARLDSVLQFELPTFGKQLKSFVGFCNYFRDHVENFSTKMFPLHELLKDYDKRRRLVWTEQSRQAFEDMKMAIHNCPSLYFMDDQLAIFLHTDASKYGIGAYLFQLTPEGRELPIAFISKTLSDTQRRWHTPQKEAYAIFYAFKQLDYLLRGVHFTLRTDHKNLIYINDTMTEMVIRWKIAVQEYDFDVEHIPGPQNIVADGLSRLIPTGDDTSSSPATTPANSSEIPNILATLCTFTPACDDDHHDLLSVFYQEEFDEDMFCAFSDDMVVEPDSKITSELRKLVSKAHNSFVGHHGVERTVAKVLSVLQIEKNKKLAEQIDLPQLTSYVKQFISLCPVCQKLSTLKVPIQANAFTTSTYEPHQRLNMDSIGPLPPDEKGNCYILVLIDTFTRWIELFPIESVTALTTAMILLQHFGRFGQAQELQSDNGSQFVNEVIRELCLIIGSEHKRTLAYSSEENAIVERANKEVLRHLRAIIHDTKVITKWYMYLPFVQRILNSAVNHNTGVSPAQLLFGNAITLNRSILVDLPVHVKQDLSTWANEMVQAQYLAIDKAAAFQQSVDAKNITKRQATEPTIFPVGDLVLLEYHKKGFKKGPPHKLLTNLKGPYQVMDIDKNTYQLRDLATDKMTPHHVKDIHPFRYDPETTDPMEVARSDKQLFIVDAIISHTGKPKLKSHMTFKVKWQGYEGHTDEYQDLPWSELRNNSVLHDYLRTHGMATLIPTAFR